MKKFAIPLLIGIMFLFFLAPQTFGWVMTAQNTINQSGFVANGSNTTINITVNVTVVNASISIRYVNLSSTNLTGWSITGSGPYNTSAIDTIAYNGTVGSQSLRAVNFTNGTLTMVPQGINQTFWFVVGFNATNDGRYNFVMNISTNDTGTVSGQFMANYSNFTIEADYTEPVLSFSQPANASTTDNSFTMSITTDEASECRYNRNGSGSYGDMSLFTNTNATSHSFSFSGDSGKIYDYFFKCMDDNFRQNTNSGFTLLEFTTRGTGSQGAVQSGGGGGGVPSITPQPQVPSEVPQGLSVVPSQMMPPPEKGTMEIIGDAIQGIINWLKSLFGG